MSKVWFDECFTKKAPYLDEAECLTSTTKNVSKVLCMFTNYQQVKNDVLGIYDEFLAIVPKVNIHSVAKSIEALEQQAVNIKRDKFSLMVAGEAKSGKSTFINAFLGKNILPMHVKQCTSAIIEIRHGNDFSLKVTYANETIKTILSEHDIQEFLVENASLNDEFRDIPISTINHEILLKYKGNIPESVISDLIMGVQEENIYNLPQDEFAKKIRAYIDTMKNEWATIVIKMEISYPFDDENLKGIEIVDSPGVNAQGRVGEITNDYINNANAIMFLKPLTGAALESTSFRRFLESASVDRSAGALFLVLTHSATKLPEDIETLRKEALKIYSYNEKCNKASNKTVSKDHILIADSKVELFIKDIENMSIDDIEEVISDEDRIDSFLLPPRSMRELNKEKYIEALRKKSNFYEIHKALNQFGRKAHYLALTDFLDRILKLYSIMEDDIKLKIELNKTKAKNPTELALRIDEIKRAVEDINNKIYKKVSEINSKYTGTDGIIIKIVEEGMRSFEADLAAMTSLDIDELEKISFKRISESFAVQDKIIKQILADCNEALVALSQNNGISYTILEPDFTPEMFKQLREKTRSGSTERIPYEEGVTFKERKYHSEYSIKKHFGKIKNSIATRLQKIGDQVSTNLREFTREVLSAYKTELANNARAKSDELNNLMEEKKTAEEIAKYIESMEDLLISIKRCKAIASERRGGLEDNE